MPMKISPRVMTNVAKSLGYATSAAFGDLMPTVKATMENNKNYVSEVYNSIKEKTAPADIKQTYPYKTGEEILRNIKADWKSGELFNKKRQQEAEDNFFSEMGFNFDDFGFDDDGSTSESTEGDVTNNNNVNNNIFMMDTGLSETVDSGISRLGNVSMSAMKMNHMGISTISKQMSTLLEFQNENSTKFYTDISTKLGDIASNIAQSTGFLGVMSEVSVGGVKPQERKSQLRDLLSLEGLDLQGYTDMYKSRLIGSGGFKDTFDMMFKPLINEWVANPFGNIMKLGIKTLMPKAFKSALGEFDQLFKYMPTMIQGKLESWKGSDNNWLAKISDMFRLDVTENRNMDFSQYEKGKVHFDGITRRSIVNVIPSLLSKILASVSKNPLHQEELVYDFEKGRFTTRKRALKGMTNDIRNFTVDNTDFKSYKEQIATEHSKDKSDDELKDFMKRIDRTMLRMIRKGTMITPETKLEDISKDPEVAQAILDNFHNQSNSGKAKYQYELLNASKSYYDVYQQVVDNEGMNNLFDIDRKINGFRPETNDELVERVKEASKWVDPNSQAGKLTSRLMNMLAPEYKDEFSVENNLSTNNPFYWLTEGVRGGNSFLSDFFFGTGTNNPKPRKGNGPQPPSPDGNDDSPSTAKPSSPSPDGNDDSPSTAKPSSPEGDNENVVNEENKGIFRLFSILGNGGNSDNPDSNIVPFVSNSTANAKGFDDDIVNTLKEHMEQKEKNSANNNILRLTQSVDKLIDEMSNNTKGEGESTVNSSSSSVNFNNEQLNLLPKINDNILHIIALLEAKFGTDGVQVNKIGKLKGKFSDYKNRTFEWFNKFFNKKDKEDGDVEIKKYGIFDSIFDMLKGGEGKKGLIQRLIGKEGILTTFITKTFDTINDVVKNNLPKIRDSLFDFSKSFLNFSGEVLTTALDLGKRGLEDSKNWLENRRNNREDGKSGLFGNILSGLGSLGSTVLQAGGSALDGVKGFFNKDSKAKGEKKFNFSIPEIFDKIFNKDKKTINVLVDGGYLDGIREVVKVTTHIGDRNTAQEQIEDFEKKQDLREAKRDNPMKKALEDKVKGIIDEEGKKEGGGFISNILSGMASEALGEIAGNVLGDRFGRRGRRGLPTPNGTSGGLPIPNSTASRSGGTAGSLAGNVASTALDVGTELLDGRGGRRNNPDILDADEMNGRPRRNVGPRRRGIGGLVDRAREGITGVKNRVGGLTERLRNRNSNRQLRIGDGTNTRGTGRLGKGLKVAGKVGKGLLRGAKFIPGIGLVAGGAMGIADAVSGFASGGSAFGTDPTLGQRFAGAGGSLLSGLTFGLMNEQKTAQGIHRLFGGDKQVNEYEDEAIKPKGSYAKGGVIDYTGTAQVHGSTAKPEMVLNSEQTTGFFNYIKQMSDSQARRDKEEERESKRGEYSNDPMTKVATWMERLGKFFSPRGAGGILFGGMLGGILGNATGIFGKVGGFFKGLFGKIFGGGEAEASGGGGSNVSVGGSLGHISEKYESGGNGPGTVGWDSTGGHSYGTYQIASKTGTMNSFMNYLKSSNPDYYQKLSAGGSPGSSGFTSAWKALASSDEKGFGEAQRAFIGQSHYKPAADKIMAKTGIDVSKRSQAVQEVAWSTGVQHGAGGASSLWSNAGVSSEMSDEQIIKAVYAERKKVGKYFGSSTSQVQQSVLNRFNNEEKDVLGFLQSGGGSGSGSGGDPDSSVSGSARDKVVKGGQTYIGKLKYAFGGTSIESGSGDCSAFTRHVFKKFASHDLGRTTGDQVLQGSKVSDGSEQPGDLVFFKGTYNSNHPYGVSHVGIVIGNGQFVHLAGSGCQVSSYKSGYWGQHYLMVRSYLSGSSSSSGSSSATPKTSSFDEQAQSNRDGWFTDVWGSKKEYSGPFSDSSSGWEGGPTSSYSKVSGFANLGSIGKAVTGGGAYGGMLSVAGKGMGSGGDMPMDDSRWTVSNLNNSSSLINNMNKINEVNSNVLTNPSKNVSNSNILTNPNGNVSNGGDSSSVVNNKTVNDMLNKNSDDISLMQNLMKQLNETSQRGNDTLSQMLDVLVEIRESAKNGGQIGSAPIPVSIVSSGNNSNSGNNSGSGSNNGNNSTPVVIDSSGFGGSRSPFTGIRGSGAGSSQPSSAELSTLLAGY
jgi:cell wall-associated NlpC family hydrolase